MSNSKEGNKSVVKVNDVEYPVQHPGVRWYIKHTDASRDKKGNLSNEMYIDGLLEMVVVKEVKMEDFNEVGELQELVEKLESFLGA